MRWRWDGSRGFVADGVFRHNHRPRLLARDADAWDRLVERASDLRIAVHTLANGARDHRVDAGHDIGDRYADATLKSG